MRPVIITIITTLLQVCLWMTDNHVSALPQGSSTDPCEDSPCGKGAECKPMGSIAICVCPDEDKGDPFVACMKQGSPPSANDSVPSANAPISASSSIPSPSSTAFNIPPPIVASFDIGTVAIHQARTVATSSLSTTTPTPSSSSTSSSPTTTLRPPSNTPSGTTTRNPFLHNNSYHSSQRPATINHSASTGPFSNHNFSHGQSNNNNNNNGYNLHIPPHQNYPESHRIPIISEQQGGSHHYQHEYPPRPITSSPGYSPYGNGGSDIFNEKTYAPIADFGMTNSHSYSNRGQTGHLSGSHHAYEYDSRPIAGSHSYSDHRYSPEDRFGHHTHHPATAGFPDPITESSSSRYNGGGTPPYNTYNSLRNEFTSPSYAGGNDPFTRIADPMGKYENCRMVNGIVVCADNSNRGGDLGYVHGGTTTNYGFHSSRDRDQYSSYYPIPSSSSRYPSSSSMRPYDYDRNNGIHRHGYPQHHEVRQPIDRVDTVPTFYPFPKEQRVSTQSIHAILPPVSTSTSRNDNEHHLCRAMCGINSICRLVMERPVCGCAEGHTGDPSVRCDPLNKGANGSSNPGYCERHVDCKESEICAKNRCVDPCKEEGHLSSSSVAGDFSGSRSNSYGGGTGEYIKASICGTNAECLVVGHTPVCKCHQGYFGNPYVACVP